MAKYRCEPCNYDTNTYQCWHVHKKSYRHGRNVDCTIKNENITLHQDIKPKQVEPVIEQVIEPNIFELKYIELEQKYLELEKEYKTKMFEFSQRENEMLRKQLELMYELAEAKYKKN